MHPSTSGRFRGLNVATNPYYRGQFGGDWIAKKLNGKGT
jgi:ribose transport system substrate-binding protein